MIRLFADSAVVTVVRPLASSAYGSYNLELPDYLDEEDFHQFDADGNELGYVAQLRPEVRTGGFARRFIRADVSVTAQDPKDLELEGKSDVDRVLSEARDQVAEDFFLESSIPSSGLGPWVPFVDFRVGDLVEVDILGRIVVLPVTRIEPVISDHSLVDWVVHVGGQLLNDEQERVASNEEIYRALIEDRRDLVGLQANTQRVASGLKDIEEKAVVSTLVEYSVSQDETTPPTSGWVTESPTREPGEYVWFRTTTTYGSGETSTSAPALITGNDGTPGPAGADGTDGKDGLPGKDGVGLEDTTVTYVVSTSGTTVPVSGWSTSVPTLTKGRYLWTRTEWKYSDNSTEYGYSVAYLAKDGSDGDDGLPGKDGTTLTSTSVTYTSSSSGTSAPSSGWTTTVPPTTPGRFVWTKTTWSYSDGTTETAYSVGKIGDTGTPGQDGSDGLPGKDGRPGKDGQDGTDGEDGSDGVSVVEVTPYFRLIRNDKPAPAKPSGLSPSGWSRTEAPYVSGHSLYRSDRTLLDNGDFSWSDVSKVSAYTASVEAMERAQKAIDDAKKAQDEADKAFRDAKKANEGLGELTQEVEQKIGDQGTLTKQLNNAATQEQYNDLNTRLWGDQGEINKINTDFQKQQGQINDQNYELMMSQSTQILLHNNQLKWARWTQPFQRRIESQPGVPASLETGMVDVYLNGDRAAYEVIVRPGWKGRWEASRISPSAGTEKGETEARSYLAGTPGEGYNLVLTVWPEHGSDPREWIVESVGGGFRVESQLWSDSWIEGPSSDDDGYLRFPVDVVSSRAVEVLRWGAWTEMRSGSVISEGTLIRPAPAEGLGVTIFTEKKPPLRWEPEGYEGWSGEQRVDAAVVTLPNVPLGSPLEYVTIAEWTAPEWDEAISTRLYYEVTFAGNDPDHEDYRSGIHGRLLVNGRLLEGSERSGRLDSRLSDLSNYGLTSVSVPPGAVVEFQVGTTGALYPIRAERGFLRSQWG